MHPGGRITITPEALRAALAAHDRIADACASLGITRQAIHAKHKDGRPQRPDLLAVLRQHQLQQAIDSALLHRDRNGKAQTYTLHVDAATLARLDANGKRQRSATARKAILAALDHLPEPELAGPLPVRLDLGPTWDAVGARRGTQDPEKIAAAIRGILAAKKKC